MVSEKWFKETDVYDLQYFEETDAETQADTFHDPGGATNANFISKQATLSAPVDLGIIPIYGGYGRQPYYIEKTIETAGIAFDFPLRKTKSINFLKYLVNAPVATGTCDKALSLCCKMNDGVTTYYFKVKHARLASGVITCSPGLLMASVQISCHYSAFDTSAPTNWTLIDDPGTTSFPFIRASDGGANNWSIKELSGSTTYTPKVSSAMVQFTNELDFVRTQDHVSGWYDNPVDRQSIGGAINVNARSTGTQWKDIWDELYDADYWDIDWSILSGVHALDVNSAMLTGTMIPPASRVGPRVLPLGIVDCTGTKTLS